MTVIYIVMLVTGIGGICFGFWGQQSLKAPYDSVAALALPFSLILAIFATLLLCVPHFFS